MLDENHNYYSTADLALAAAISISSPLESIDKTDSHRVLFVFMLSKQIEEFIDKYWRRELRVEPRCYFDQLRALKARIYD